MDKEGLDKRLSGYPFVHMDIGCGDGKYPYTLAREYKELFAIGIDASGDSMIEYSVRSKKKEAKGGAPNLLYCISAIEEVPRELWCRGDALTVLLPWGSLLEGMVKGEETILKNIVRLGKGTGTSFMTVFSYSTLHEGHEVEKRELPDLTMDYLEGELKSRYEKSGIDIERVEKVADDFLKDLGTLWAKTLIRGKKREVYQLSGKLL